MNEEELLEALKILNTPITIHNETYHYFDDENFNNLKRVFENCQYVLTKEEYIMQNAVDNKKKVDQLTNNWNELEKDINNQLMMTRKFDDYNEGYFDATLHYYNKMKEISGGK